MQILTTSNLTFSFNFNILQVGYNETNFYFKHQLAKTAVTYIPCSFDTSLRCHEINNRFPQYN